MYQIAILLSKEVTDVILLVIQQILEQNDFVSSIIKRNGDRILLLYMRNNNRLEQALEELHIELPKYKHTDQMKASLRHHKSQKYNQFIKMREYLPNEINQTEQYSRFKLNHRDKYINPDTNELEIDNELIEIAIYHILAKIEVNGQIVELISSIKNVDDQQKYLIVFLKNYNIITDVCPLRTFKHSTLSELKQAYTEGVGYLDYIVSRVKLQMGEQMAFYFAFLLYLIKNMAILAILGILTYSLDELFDFDVTTSPFEPLYAALTVIWGAYFVGKWSKKQKQYAILWRSQGENYNIFQKTLELSLIKCLSHEDHFLIQKKIQQITYNKMLDPVTGLEMQYQKEAYKIYFNSLLKTAPYVIGLVFFLIISLNARGYIHPDGFLHMAFLQQWAKPGRIFDPLGWGSMILTVFHVLVVFVLNLKYKEISIATTLQEDHKSLHAFETSLIIKRFAFEIFSAFLDFFYIGFILADIVQLKSEMVSMFAVDEIRRIVTETLIPSLQKLQLQREINQLVDQIQEIDIQRLANQVRQNVGRFKPHLKSQLISIYLPKYESFDDYLEIVLNFGYLCFFTSAYRMAGVVIAVFLLFEFLSDYYKVYHLYQKPFSMKSHSIGPWTRSMDVICVVSVFTNLLLFSIASDQIVEFFPWLFKQPQQEPQFQVHMLLQAKPVEGKQSEMVLILFLLEHILLFGVFIVRKYSSQRRTWSEIYLERQAYKNKIT